MYSSVVLLVMAVFAPAFGRIIPAPPYFQQPSLSLLDVALLLSGAAVDTLLAVIVIVVGRSLLRRGATPSKEEAATVILSGVAQPVTLLLLSAMNGSLSNLLYFASQSLFGFYLALPLGFGLSVGGALLGMTSSDLSAVER